MVPGCEGSPGWGASADRRLGCSELYVPVSSCVCGKKLPMATAYCARYCTIFSRAASMVGLERRARVTSWFRAGSLKLCHHVSRETLPTRGCCGSSAFHFSGMFCISGRSKSGPTLHVEHPGTPSRHSVTMSDLAMPALSPCDRTREERLWNGEGLQANAVENTLFGIRHPECKRITSRLQAMLEEQEALFF